MAILQFCQSSHLSEGGNTAKTKYAIISRFLTRHLLILIASLFIFSATENKTATANTVLNVESEVRYVDRYLFFITETLSFQIDVSLSSGEARDLSGARIGTFSIKYFTPTQSNYEGILEVITDQRQHGYAKHHIFLLDRDGHKATYAGLCTAWPPFPFSIDLATQPGWSILARYMENPSSVAKQDFDSMVTGLLHSPAWYNNNGYDFAWQSTLSATIVDRFFDAYDDGQWPSSLLPSFRSKFLMWMPSSQLREETVARLHNIWQLLSHQERINFDDFLLGTNHSFKTTTAANAMILEMLSLEGYRIRENSYNLLVRDAIKDSTLPETTRRTFIDGYLNEWERIPTSEWGNVEYQFRYNLLQFINEVIEEQNLWDIYRDRASFLIERQADYYLSKPANNYYLIENVLLKYPQAVSLEKLANIAQRIISEPLSNSLLEGNSLLGILQHPGIEPALRNRIWDRLIAKARRMTRLSDLISFGAYYFSEVELNKLQPIFGLIEIDKVSQFVNEYQRVLMLYVPDSQDTLTFYYGLTNLVSLIKAADLSQQFSKTLEPLMRKLNPQQINEASADYEARIAQVLEFWEGRKGFRVFYWDTSIGQDKLVYMERIKEILDDLYPLYWDTMDVLGLDNFARWFGLSAGSIGPFAEDFANPQLMPHELAHSLDVETSLQTPFGKFAIGSIFRGFGADRNPESFSEYVMWPSVDIFYHSLDNDMEDFAMTVGNYFQDSQKLFLDALDLQRQNKPILLSKLLYIMRFFQDPDSQALPFFFYDEEIKRYERRAIPVSRSASGRIDEIEVNGIRYAFTYDLNETVISVNEKDTSAPTTPIVTDDGAKTTKQDQLYASWVSSDPESGTAEYRYKITEDSIAGRIIKDWASTGTDNFVTATGLNLIYGKIYYFSVQARNNGGLRSEIGYSDGIAFGNNPPLTGTIIPSGGTSELNQRVNFTATYSDHDGWQNIQSAYLLINATTGGTNCFYGYYNQQTNKLYLKNDANTSWQRGFSPGSANTIENSYAKLDCSQTTVSDSGNTLTINWAVTFKAPFTGMKNTYLAVKDDVNAPLSWAKAGSWSLPNQAPVVGAITSRQGTFIPLNQPLTFTTTYTDPDGWQNIQYIYFLLDSSKDGINSFFGYYNQNNQKLYLRNDTNTAWLGGFLAGSNNIIENSYAKLDCSQTDVSGSEDRLVVNWAATFKPPFAGTKNAYLYVKDDAGQYNGWVNKDTFHIGN